MAEIQFTKITAHRPKVLTKSYHLDTDGNLVKTPGGPLIEGLAEKLTINGLDELPPIIKDMEPGQAFIYGVSEFEKARILTKKALARSTGGGEIPYIARTRDYFSYPTGPGVMPFDFDGFQADHADEIFKLLVELNPVFKTAPMIIFPSASSLSRKSAAIATS